jgi:phosphoribosyl-dephospho-CoA transferase
MDSELAPDAAREPTRVPLDRHTLVWVGFGERERMYALATDEVRRHALRRWFANDWPLVVRRPGDDARAGRIALGLPLPPSEGKRRLCFELPERAIARWSPPLRVCDAAPRLPLAWRKSLAALGEQAAQCGVTLRVFGSVAWQALTGLDYLTARSDVDLWWQPADADQLETVVAIIARWEKRHGVRADGEISFPYGAAVAWREWHASRSNDRVLVKRIDACELMWRSALAATLQVDKSDESDDS